MPSLSNPPPNLLELTLFPLGASAAPRATSTPGRVRPRSPRRRPAPLLPSRFLRAPRCSVLEMI
eukprot:2108576-Rhodomonas_salina.1